MSDEDAEDTADSLDIKPPQANVHSLKARSHREKRTHREKERRAYASVSTKLALLTQEMKILYHFVINTSYLFRPIQVIQEEGKRDLTKKVIIEAERKDTGNVVNIVSEKSVIIGIYSLIFPFDCGFSFPHLHTNLDF